MSLERGKLQDISKPCTENRRRHLTLGRLGHFHTTGPYCVGGAFSSSPLLVTSLYTYSLPFSTHSGGGGRRPVFDPQEHYLPGRFPTSVLGPFLICRRPSPCTKFSHSVWFYGRAHDVVVDSPFTSLFLNSSHSPRCPYYYLCRAPPRHP